MNGIPSGTNAHTCVPMQNARAKSRAPVPVPVAETELPNVRNVPAKRTMFRFKFLNLRVVRKAK